jgi:hypothetical protein
MPRPRRLFYPPVVRHSTGVFQKIFQIMLDTLAQPRYNNSIVEQSFNFKQGVK